MRGVRIAWAFAVGTALLASGCGPIEYLNTTTFQASHAVDEARKVHADQLSPYEYTKAVEYLHKSREVAGFARWQEAVQFGKEALDNGRLAHEKSSQKGGLPTETTRSGGLE
jgi:hypothetical protein